MSRPMKFDKQQAIEAAMNQFWQTGYDMNSVKALSAHLGITRSSFYNTFSSRENLFREAIELYIADPMNNALYAIPSDKPFKPEVSRVFRELCKTRTSDIEHRGCLLVNSIAELSVSEDGADLVAYLNHIVQQGRALLVNRIEMAQNAGEFTSKLDANKLALSLQNLNFGTNLMSKLVHDEQDLWASCEPILGGLGFLKV